MDSYDILGVSRDASDKEIEVAYEDLKKKYDPSFNTSIHAYKKYREILKAYEDIRDEQRRKMYDLKDDTKIEIKEKSPCLLYDFVSKSKDKEIEEIDYSKVEDFQINEYKDVEVVKEISYLYKLLNLKCDVAYVHKVKCGECRELITCPVCNGKKIVKYQEKEIYCPVCHGEGKVSHNCKNCGDTGFVEVKNTISFAVDEDVKVFKGYGDDYGSNSKSNLKVIFKFNDKDNILVKDRNIEVTYYLNKEETVRGFKKEFLGDNGAFNIEIPPFVENGYKYEVNFNNYRVIFNFINDKYDGNDRDMYLFINKSYDGKYLFFNDDYSECSIEETSECQNMLKCSSKIIVENLGEKGMYGGMNGNLNIHVEFNNDNEILYLDNVKVLDTSKMFNLLGGRFEGIYHYGFKGKNCLVKKEGFYYLLKGNNREKQKLKRYFLFKTLVLLIWFLIPLIALFVPYSKVMFISLISCLIVYFFLSNFFMGMEV